MDTIEFNAYFNPNPQSFQYLGFGNDAGGPIPSMETPFDANDYLSTSFDYNFDASLGQNDSIAMPADSTSASPPAQQLSLLPNGSVDSGLVDMDNEVLQGRRSSSEEKDNMTPAQSRRKAQNRAAQRAFRERKEKHVRDLENKLNQFTSRLSMLQTDNERLQLLLQRSQTENEILKATASSPSGGHHAPGFFDDPNLVPSPRPQHDRSSDEGPPLDRGHLANGVLATETSPSNRPAPRCAANMLSASATWDLLQSHPLYLSGSVDIGEVCERLKRKAKCDGMGPMFDEEEVRMVIEDVGRSGNDELI